MIWFDEIRRTQLARFDRINPPVAAWLRESGGIYLYGTIGSEAILLPSGAVRMSRADQWPESDVQTEREATTEERIAALVLGAEKWPQIAELLPARPTDAVDCSACRGAGMIPRPGGVICSKCHGLGWVSSNISQRLSNDR
jgi:hypothetical protein